MTLAVNRAPQITPLEPEAVARLQASLRAKASNYLDELEFDVAPEDYRALCERVHAAGFDFPRCLSGTDMEYGLRVTLHLQQLQTKRKIVIRTDLPYGPDGTARVASVSDLWGGVEWHEREAYDLVGIHFDGHPDHRRILLEDDWTTHPLQRKYNTRGYVIPSWTAKPFPSPAPWEVPAEASAGVAEAPVVAQAHAAPAAPASPAPTAPVQAEAPSSPAASAADSSAPAPECTKPVKRWEPKKPAGDAAASETPASEPVAQALVSSAPTAEAAPAAIQVPAAPDGAQPDDLKRIEGIGPKIDAALKAAGLSTFVQLEKTSAETLRAILERAELPAQASVVTWGEQAGFLVRGDEAGFKALTDRLTAGRDQAKAAASVAEPAVASAAEAVASSAPEVAPESAAQPTPSGVAESAPAEPEKPRSPKIKRWEPKT